MPSTRKHLARRSLLIALVVAVALLALCQAALAAAAGSFTVYEVDKSGNAQQIGTWTYDATNHTLIGAPFVQALTSTDYQGSTLPYLPFSGQDAYSSNTKMAVATKGFYVDDLAGWAATANGIPLGGDTSFNVTCSDTNGTFYYPTPWTLAHVDSRYWYPSYNFSATPATATWDDATRVPRRAVLAIQGNSLRRYQTTPTNPTDYATLLTSLGNMAASVGDTNSLQLWMGQVEGDYTDLNLGSNAAKWIESLTFAPAYLKITTSVAGGGGTATVTTDDGYLKATAGEPVSFTVDNVTSGYSVDSVMVKDSGGHSVSVSESSRSYSFTMPASDATIAVGLVTPSLIDLAGASIAAIPTQTYAGSALRPAVKVVYGGATLAEGVDYMVDYAGNTVLGAATATITGIGTCTGTNSATFLIIPDRAVLITVRAGHGTATVTWKRSGGGVGGYGIAYRRKGDSFYGTAGNTSGLSKVVRGLRRGHSYTFKVRAYKVIGAKTYYGSWSRAKSVTVK